ncbi:MAG: hypothetical protein KTR25_14065 [Myxococcales bacterium]|nr:hypothetical protein [Myxococcales bacterium]
MSLHSDSGDDAVARVCEGSPAGGTGCTRPRDPKGWRSHRPLTNAGNKSERGRELKDTPSRTHQAIVPICHRRFIAAAQTILFEIASILGAHPKTSSSWDPTESLFIGKAQTSQKKQSVSLERPQAKQASLTPLEL